MAELLHGQIVDGHLGGFVPLGDANTLYPALWAWLAEDYGITSVLDVGCGDGKGALDTFLEHGVDAYGIDGIDTGHPRVYVQDYTKGAPYAVTAPDGRVFPTFDLVWSCEFVEHVEEAYVRNFLRDFQRAPLVLMTHAVPGQGGWHHVNCQTTDYWRGVMAAVGYYKDDELTAVTRELALKDCPGDYPFYAHTGLAFRRYER